MNLLHYISFTLLQYELWDIYRQIVQDRSKRKISYVPVVCVNAFSADQKGMRSIRKAVSLEFSHFMLLN